MPAKKKVPFNKQMKSAIINLPRTQQKTGEIKNHPTQNQKTLKRIGNRGHLCVILAKLEFF
jgi:hypothetical protein